MTGLYRDRQSGDPSRCLVVVCHGIAADEHQSIRFARGWAEVLPDLSFAAPRAPFIHRARRSRWSPWTRLNGREWFGLAHLSPSEQAAQISATAAALDHFIDSALRRFDLPPAAYALAGFSQGAMIALFAGLRRAVAPVAIVSYAGGVLVPGTLEGEIRNRPPVLLVHGELDDVVPSARSRSAELLLRGLGVPVDSLYPPGLGHVIDEAGGRAGARFLRNVLDRDQSAS